MGTPHLCATLKWHFRQHCTLTNPESCPPACPACSLLFAALAALFCGALAGPYEGEGGCYSSDDIPR